MNRIFPVLFATSILVICSMKAIEAQTPSSISGIRIIQAIHNSKKKASLEQSIDQDQNFIEPQTKFLLAQSPAQVKGAPPPALIPPPPATGTTANDISPGSINIQNPPIYPNSGSQGIPITPQGMDATSQLALKKGMKLVFSIKRGLDTRWKHVGNYDFFADIEFNDARGYAFDWHMSPPANATGSRRVELEDMKNAHKVSLFYPDNESATLVGYTSIVRISDFHYNKLKAGEKVEFELDGPDSPLVMKRHTRPVPHNIQASGYEDLNIAIDGIDTKVRTIKATTDIGWSYWILDNPNFPLMVQGDGPFQWRTNILASSGTGSGTSNTTGSSDQNKNKSKAKREARNVIDQLTKEGKATSYLILFDFDSDRLRPLSKEILVELSQFLKKKASLHLKVEGHTCNIGGKDYNLNLSQRRAQSVKKFLVEHCGINSTRLVPIGYGFSKPVKSNSTEAGRQKNRRVVFTEISK